MSGVRKADHYPVNFSSKHASSRRTTIAKKPSNWNRKCQRCGGDPWPNYLLCPYCREIRLIFHDGGIEIPYERLDYRVSGIGVSNE